jgi:D-amino-acid dehydrogenase
MKSTTPPITVVGAGIIGTAIAFELQRRGHSVLLIDRNDPGRGASYGNMASIAVSEFMPISRPSIWRQLPKWLLDPNGPIRLRPSYLPRLAPWLLRFAAAGLPSRVRQIETAGAALCARVYDDLLPLLAAAGASDMLSSEGCISIYANEGEFAADREHIELLDRFGIAHDVLSGDAIRDLEPALGPRIKRAVLLPQNRSIRDPYLLVLALLKRFREIGGRFDTGEVIAFERSENSVTGLHLADGRRLPIGQLVLCAGAFTGRLSKLLGDPIPLETERGYHSQIMLPGISMRHSLVWPARAFMVTPTGGGIRIGGTVEMAGLEAPPDYRRAQVLVRHARVALPDLQANDVSEWMGHRPALPDTVPIIGPSARASGVFYATGHGHLGLTYAATTAKLTADLVTGVPPVIDLMPYRVNRF